MDTACSSDGSMAASSSSHAAASHVGSTSGEETVTGTGSDTSTTCTPTLKKPRYACRFHPDSNQFTWAKVSRKGPSFAYCTTCSRNISVAYGGCTEVWMTILESGWNLWVWLVGVVNRRWVWLVGGIYGYGYNV